MNISFNKKVRKEDTIKSQIDQFKLKIDEKNRYLTNFDIVLPSNRSQISGDEFYALVEGINLAKYKIEKIIEWIEINGESE